MTSNFSLSSENQPFIPILPNLNHAAHYIISNYQEMHHTHQLNTKIRALGFEILVKVYQEEKLKATDDPKRKYWKIVNQNSLSTVDIRIVKIPLHFLPALIELEIKQNFIDELLKYFYQVNRKSTLTDPLPEGQSLSYTRSSSNIFSVDWSHSRIHHITYNYQLHTKSEPLIFLHKSKQVNKKKQEAQTSSFQLKVDLTFTNL